MKNRTPNRALFLLSVGLLTPAVAHNLSPKSFADLKNATQNFAHAGSAKLAGTQKGVRLNGPMPNFAISDVYGKGYTKASFQGKLLLVVLADTQCPCVQAVEMRLRNLGTTYDKAGLRPVYLFSKPGDRPIDVARFMQEHRINFPAFLDPKQGMLRMLDGQCSSEVYLFDRKGILRYHGRVDDSTFDPKAVHSKDLENAIQAVIKGKKVARQEVPAMGCAIPRI